MLVNRSRHLREKYKKLKGSAPRQVFFQHRWLLSLDRQKEVKFDAKLESENAKFKETVSTLKETIAAGSGKDNHVCGREYSSRHERRLKKQRLSDYAQSLQWLENEGLAPLKVESNN